MLTPVEEAGLAGQRLAGRVRKALYGLGDPALHALLTRLDAESRSSHLIYMRDDRPEPIRVLAAPLAALPDQLSYVRAVTLALNGALKRLPELYFADPEVRRVLQLPEIEEDWLRTYWHAGVRAVNTVFGRHDAVCDFASSAWKSSLWFIEPNMSGIGGLHMVPSAGAVLARTVLPVLHRADPQLQLELTQDIRSLLMQELVDHLDAIGRPGRTICFVEPKYAGSGPDEQDDLARHLHDRFGVQVCHADPAELQLVGDEVRYEGRTIDLAYRDYGVVDLLDAAADGTDIAPMRALFAQNRMVSSIAAELDQKSCWEVFTDPVLAARHFTTDEQQVFRHHVPWTRLVADRATTLPDGRTGGLLPYAIAERDHLVLKPNRSYGGTGVVIGAASEPVAWARALEVAAADPERWVVQRAVTLPVVEFPVLGDDGGVHAEPFYVVLGFTASSYGLASVGRASQHRVVNVAQRGGLCVIVVGHPPGRLIL